MRVDILDVCTVAWKLSRRIGRSFIRGGPHLSPRRKVLNYVIATEIVEQRDVIA